MIKEDKKSQQAVKETTKQTKPKYRSALTNFQKVDFQGRSHTFL